MCRLDLNEGSHILLPYSPGCWLQRDGGEEGEEGGAEDVPLIEEKERKKVLTLKCMYVESVLSFHAFYNVFKSIITCTVHVLIYHVLFA